MTRSIHSRFADQCPKGMCLKGGKVWGQRFNLHQADRHHEGKKHFLGTKPFWNRIYHLLSWTWAVTHGTELTTLDTWKKSWLVSGATKTVLGNYDAFNDFWPKLKAQKYSILPQSGTVFKWGSCTDIFVLTLFTLQLEVQSHKNGDRGPNCPASWDICRPGWT